MRCTPEIEILEGIQEVTPYNHRYFSTILNSNACVVAVIIHLFDQFINKIEILNFV